MPRDLNEALAAVRDHPGAVVLGGGTDVMVGVNESRGSAASFVSLRRVHELRGWSLDAGRVVIGATTTYADLAAPDLVRLAPAVAQAARTVGSPQIRNGGTVGGNVCTASPAGDLLPVFAALDAEVQVCSSSTVNWVPLTDFVTGVKKTVLQPGELVTAVRLAVVPGPQEFLKVGTRNAMVISVVSVAVCLDEETKELRVAPGAVLPRPSRLPEAEAYGSDYLSRTDVQLDPGALDRFGDLVAAGSRPIDDHRSSAAYRRHAVAVCARRALARLAGRRAGRLDFPGGDHE